MMNEQRALQDARKEFTFAAQVSKPFRKGFSGGRPFVVPRQDLFGIIDILALSLEGATFGIQATGADVQSHIRKILESPVAEVWLQRNHLQIWAYRKMKVKRGGVAVRWERRVVLFGLVNGKVEHWESSDDES